MALSVSSSVIATVIGEAIEADRKYGEFSSAHEAYGVLAEEMLELLEAIRRNDPFGIRDEATDVAAVAARLADACQSAIDRETDFGHRSGF